jgi:hypothetical protein
MKRTAKAGASTATGECVFIVPAFDGPQAGHDHYVVYFDRRGKWRSAFKCASLADARKRRAAAYASDRKRAIGQAKNPA